MTDYERGFIAGVVKASEVVRRQSGVTIYAEEILRLLPQEPTPSPAAPRCEECAPSDALFGVPCPACAAKEGK